MDDPQTFGARFAGTDRTTRRFPLWTRPPRSPLRIALALLCGVGLLAAPWSEAPFVGLLSLAVVSLLALGSVRPRSRILTWNLATVLAVLLLFEAACWRADVAKREGERQRFLDHAFMRSDPDLGYAPRAGRTIRISPAVAYTIDGDGLRSGGATTVSREDAAGLLFFVDSFTFGEHVADEQAYPHRVAAGLGSAWRVFNFAYIGYGPHQMLSMLETGLVERIVDRRPSHAFYLALEDHVDRAAGRRFWDVHGPRYALRRGRPVRAGNFDDPWAPGQSVLTSSYLARRIAAGARDSEASRGFEPDLRLFSAIVRESVRRLQTAYPGIEVHILFWSASSPRSTAIRDALARSEAKLHDVVQVLGTLEHRDAYRDFPGYGSTSPIRFQLSETDLHPNPWAHAILADYVAEVVRGSDGGTTATPPHALTSQSWGVEGPDS